MDKYMRLWNEGGDYLEFPPNIYPTNGLSYITFDENGGEQLTFTLNSEDLEHLIDWAIEQKKLQSNKTEAP